jgi:hypothetical protein
LALGWILFLPTILHKARVLSLAPKFEKIPKFYILPVKKSLFDPSKKCCSPITILPLGDILRPGFTVTAELSRRLPAEVFRLCSNPFLPIFWP